MQFNRAADIKSLTSAVPEAKYSQTQTADGHRMTLKMDEALKVDAVWKAGGLHQADVLDGGEVCGWVKNTNIFP